ncbi:hypothetical protein P8452_00603 [Trifolium repens]|nr:hypothetical protein P8452_00603 [Trifolium repens]
MLFLLLRIQWNHHSYFPEGSPSVELRDVKLQSRFSDKLVCRLVWFFPVVAVGFFCLWYLFILEGGLDPNLDYIIFLLWMNLMWWLLNERKTSQPSSLK